MFAIGERFMASTRSDSVIEDGLLPWGSALGENVGFTGVVIIDEDVDITEDADRNEGYDLDEEEE